MSASDRSQYLIGPNASGKSNFLDALAFLARAIRTTPSQAIEEHGGLDAILRNVPDQAESFEIEVEVNFPQDEDQPLDERPEQWVRGSYGFRMSARPVWQAALLPSIAKHAPSKYHHDSFSSP